MLKTKLLAAVLAVGATVLGAQEKRDPQAVAVAERMMEAMGGQDAWNGVRYLRFDFRVGMEGELPEGRHHLWDKWNGRYRLEQERDGREQIVLFDVNTREGRVFIDGAEVEGEGAAQALEGAYGAFINDMYWLAMPWKWLDPGVNLRYVGEQEYDGEACDVVELSFGKVGLTPGDRYQAYVTKSSDLMVHWEYTLQSDRTGAWDWQYMETGGIKLAADHVNEEGRHIHMGDVTASETVDEALFSDPEKKL